MNKSLCFWVDVDGCLAEQAVISPDKKTFHLAGKLINDMVARIFAYDPDEVYISSFSNRQCFAADMLNADATSPGKKKTLSAFTLLEALASTLKHHAQLQKQKIFFYLDRYLLSDSTVEREMGTNWAACVNYYQDNTYKQFRFSGLSTYQFPLNTEINIAKNKMDLLYCKAHQFIARHPRDQVRAIIYDDVDAILEGLTLFDTPEYQAMLPKNLSLLGLKFDGRPPSADQKIEEKFDFQGNGLGYYLQGPFANKVIFPKGNDHENMILEQDDARVMTALLKYHQSILRVCQPVRDTWQGQAKSTDLREDLLPGLKLSIDRQKKLESDIPPFFLRMLGLTNAQANN